jgi:hypothetical protein
MTKKDIKANKDLYTVTSVSKNGNINIKVLKVNDNIRDAFLKEGIYIDFYNEDGILFTEKCFCRKTIEEAQSEANKLIEHNKKFQIS